MARPRTPTSVLEARGSYKKDPQRLKDREDEPQGVGVIGEPPSWLLKDAATVWRELAASLPDGVATASDRPAFEALCNYVSSQRLDGLLESKDAARMIKLFSVFGMTLADLSRVKSSVKKKVANPFDGLRRAK
jgi:hypothetical protein